MPHFILDGKEIQFIQGQTIIEAAAKVGIDIPHFCWHPSLTVSGNCRVCLVEIEKMPKLAIACSTLASDGMVVNTNSVKALSARNAVMEFLLINHPLDCPICDEAGECKLQDYAFDHSVGESRFVENKVHKEKRVSLGTHVMFDGERCISCSRCIRFCDEIAGVNELTFIHRGDKVTIDTFPGKELSNPYSLCVTDICPVGALTSKDFRFKSRVWDMSSTKTICSGCSRGCNVEMWVRNNEILRLTPRYNEEVNSYWMCDEGRLNTFKSVNADTRVNGPHIKRDGTLVKAGWDEVFALATSELKSYNKSEIAVLGSAFATCEENFVLAKFAKSVLGIKNIDFAKHEKPNSGDDILIRDDKSPNSFGAELAGIHPLKDGLNFQNIMRAIDEKKIKALYLVEDDLVSLDEDYKKILSKLELFIVHSSNFNSTTELADIVFPAATYAEKNGTWINFQGRIQKLLPAVMTVEMDRSLDGMAMSRLDKFGTEFDRWGKSKKMNARPIWKIITSLANALGTKYKYQTSEEIFDEMSKTIDLFKGLDYQRVGELGVKLNVTTLAKVKV